MRALLGLAAIAGLAAASNNSWAGRVSNLSLSMDLRGTWVTTGDRIANCDTFARTVARFGGQDEDLLARMLCSASRTITQHIWQDCLEMTITGGGITGGGVVHHMVHDGSYVTDDFHASGRPAAWRSFIEPPLPDEAADGATAVSVFRSKKDASPDGIARRYINSDGKLVFSQEFEAGAKGIFTMDLVGPLSQGCTGYSPSECADHEYTDTSELWTAACCMDTPNVQSKAEPNPKMMACEATPDDPKLPSPPSTSNGSHGACRGPCLLLLLRLLLLLLLPPA